jgi:3-hydroxymyristoyl/3-hydroxydecanoyl-(acyl carrier protein) dehydratase
VDTIEKEGDRRFATLRLSNGAFLTRGAPWPLTLVAEALAQATLALAGERDGAAPRLVGLDRVRLRQMLCGGEALRIEVEQEGSFGMLRRFVCRASHGGALAAEGEVTVSG